MELVLTDGTVQVLFATATGVDVSGLIRRFTPTMPDLDTQTSDFGDRDGGEVPRALYRNVQEHLSVTLVGGYALAVTAYKLLTSLLLQARQRQAGTQVERIYLEYRKDTVSAWWRSEVLGGRCAVDDGDVGWGLQTVDGDLNLELTLTRRFYWEGALMELELSNGGDGEYGVLVVNHDDAGTNHTNWFDIDGADVDGDLPAPLKFVITNYFNDVQHLDAIWIGANVNASPSTFPHILEGEDATGTTVVAAPEASAGAYGRFTYASEDIEATAFTWTLPSGLLDDAAGNTFHVMIRDVTAAGSVYLRLKLLYQALTLYEGPLTAPDIATHMWSLGSIALPPWPAGSPSAPLELVISGISTAPGTLHTLDFIQLTPTDSFVQLKSAAYGCEYGDVLVWDPIEDALYVTTTAGNLTNYVRIGAPAVEVHPGRDERIYMLQSTWQAQAPIGMVLGVHVYYRPRQLMPI